MPTEGTIGVRIRDPNELDTRTVGYFPPSQINALLGVARNSPIYWIDGGIDAEFVGWQWVVPERQGRPPFVELHFR